MDSEGGRMQSYAVLHDDTTKIASPSHHTGEITAFPRSCGSPAEPSPPPTPTVLLVGKCVRRETGNATTLARLGRTVSGGRWESVTRDPDSIPDTAALQVLAKRHNIVAVLGLHAYRSAHVLLSCQELGLPYVTVFGGTDVNECVKDAVKKDIMERVVVGAKSLVAFQAMTRKAVLEIWPSLPPDKIWIIPQAVEVDPEPNFNMLSYLETVESAHVDNITHNIDHEPATLQLKNQDAEKFVQSEVKYERKVSGDHSVVENVCPKENAPPPEDNRVTTQNENLSTPQRESFSGTVGLPTQFQPLVLLVAGLRPVKDVLYLAEAWSRWQRARGGRGRFLILGPSLDLEYAAHVHAQLSSLSGVRVCPTLSPRECQTVMKNATVLVNSSRSESMSSSILEAMALGTPVIARDIQGNAAIITHGHTGLLYSSPDDFIREFDSLLQDSGLRDRLVTAAKEQVARCHSLQQEKDLLLRILDQAVQ